MRSAPVLSTAILTLLSTVPAYAQQAAQDKAVTHLDPVVITTDRLGRAIKDIEGHVSVVSQEALQRDNVTDLEALTRRLPGITPSRQVSAADPFGGTSSVQIRGVDGNRVQFQIDGGRLPERIIDGSRDYLDFSFTRQAEVVRGPSSVMWGADALGGVVALRTITADDLIEEGASRGFQLTSGYNSLNKGTNTALGFAQKLSENTTLLLGQSYGQDHETTLKHAPANGAPWGCTRPIAYGSVDCSQFNPLERTTKRSLVKLEHRIDDAQKLSFSLDRMDRLSEVDVTTSLGVSGTSVITRNQRSREIERSRYAIDYEGHFAGPIDEVRASLSFSPSGYSQRGEQLSRLATGAMQLQYDRLDYSEDFLELDLQAKSNFSLGSSEHRLTFGFDGDRTETSYAANRRLRNLATGTDTTTRAGGFNFADGITQRADLYIQDEIDLLGGQLTLTPGLRYATYRMEPQVNGTVAESNAGFYGKKSENKLLGSFGATWRLDDAHSVWAHYGEGFKMPTFQQLFTSSVSGSFDLVPAPWLKPETVKSFEIGLRGDYTDASWSINAFKADYTDFIESFWFVPNSNDISYRNLSQVRTWGIEAEGNWALRPELRLNGSLAWMQGRAKASATAAETLHVVPPLQAVIGLDYDMTPDVRLNATATLVSATKAKASNFAPAGYGILDLGAKWAVSEKASLNLAVNNVLDRKYYTQGAAGSALAASAATTATVPPGLYTGAGRNISVNLDMRF